MVESTTIIVQNVAVFLTPMPPLITSMLGHELILHLDVTGERDTGHAHVPPMKIMSPAHPRDAQREALGRGIQSFPEPLLYSFNNARSPVLISISPEVHSPEAHEEARSLYFGLNSSWPS